MTTPIRSSDTFASSSREAPSNKGQHTLAERLVIGCHCCFKLCASLVLGVCLLVFCLPTDACAQSFSIDWFTIDGGGGTSTGGAYSLSGTIGQPDAGAQPMTGGSFSLVGGFWSLFAVQSPGAPFLTIRLTSTNTAIVSWPSPTGFTLQQSVELGTTNWTAAPQPVTDAGTNRFIIVNPPVGNRFYRLFGPR